MSYVKMEKGKGPMHREALQKDSFCSIKNKLRFWCFSKQTTAEQLSACFIVVVIIVISSYTCFVVFKVFVFKVFVFPVLSRGLDCYCLITKQPDFNDKLSIDEPQTKIVVHPNKVI